MRAIVLAVAGTMLMAGAAAAADCTQMATEKKLAGAALQSFMKKCNADAANAAAKAAAQDSCTKSATDKKLAGAAQKSFVTKCVKDATAPKAAPAATPAAAKK